MGATVVSEGKLVKNCWGCSKCKGFFFCSDFQKTEKVGLCAGGDRHKQGTVEFSIADYGKGEAGWKFCKQCACLFLGGATNGSCVNGCTHVAESSVTLTVEKHARAANVTYMFAWGRCGKCQCMFLTGGTNGACPKGGKHEAAGSEIYVCSQTSSSG